MEQVTQPEAESLLARMRRVRQRDERHYRTRCPAHPQSAIDFVFHHVGVRFNAFCGCTFANVRAAVQRQK